MAFIDRVEHIRRSTPKTQYTIITVSVIVIFAGIISVWIAQLPYELREEPEGPSLADSFQSAWKKIKSQKPNFSQ